MREYPRRSPAGRKPPQQWLKVIALCVALCIIFGHTSNLAKAKNLQLTGQLQLPPLRTHPLPSSLAQWHDPDNQGDYFSQVAPTDAGYFVWTEFPVKVYIEQPTAIPPKVSQVWTDTVLQAVQEWTAYLPLEVVKNPDAANITVSRLDPNQRVGRIRAAETYYELYVNQLGILSHRFTILIRPRHVSASILATARHELGHALGIWGHSPLETDALYFSQVRNPPNISIRDVNTLKRVYQQPTRLGWPLPGILTKATTDILLRGLLLRILEDNLGLVILD